MSTTGPEKPLHSAGVLFGAAWLPPSCSSSTIALTPLALSSVAYLLAVVTSSRKSTLVMPLGLTMLGVPSRVMPTKPTLTPPTLRIL